MVKDIDVYDTLFVALAIETNSFLWTGDKKLYYGLKAIGFDKILNTNEITGIYNRIS